MSITPPYRSVRGVLASAGAAAAVDSVCGDRRECAVEDCPEDVDTCDGVSGGRRVPAEVLSSPPCFDASFPPLVDFLAVPERDGTAEGDAAVPDFA